MFLAQPLLEGGGSVRVDTRMSVEVGCTDRGFVEVCTLCGGVGAF